VQPANAVILPTRQHGADDGHPSLAERAPHQRARFAGGLVWRLATAAPSLAAVAPSWNSGAGAPFCLSGIASVPGRHYGAPPAGVLRRRPGSTPDQKRSAGAPAPATGSC